MKLFNKKHILLLIGLIFLAGCATQSQYFKLEQSLQKDIKVFDGTQYVPLSKACDVYGAGFEWDPYIQKASVKKDSYNIALRAYSDRVLINGAEKRLDRPVVLDNGIVFVPVSSLGNFFIPLPGPVYVEKTPVVAAPGRFIIRTIVLDPGHGGKDAGAVGRRLRLKEKDTALALAKMIKARLEKAGVRVIMTRDSDNFISLSRRADMANRNKADLFVSVHINASKSRSMRGFECYYLSSATDDNARALEAFENSVLKLDADAEKENSKQLDKTLWDMTLTENRIESAELAGYICQSVEDSLTIRNRGIRSARFYVLKHTHMPSVLVEAGYISNRYEELKLKDPKFLEKIADAVAKGIIKYKTKYESTEGFTKT